MSEISSRFVRLFDLRWTLDRIGYDPCDEWFAEDVLGLPEGLSYRGGRFVFNCRVCEAETEWQGEPNEFEDGHSANVCGGSPRCCP